MANLSVTLFPSLLIDGNTVFPIISNKAKGRGYLDTGGMHTVQYTTLNNFVGVVKIQATLATEPAETDWFDVHGVYLGDNITPVPDGAVTQNFTGNFVWVRAVVVSHTAGNINRVLFNHS
jgi:hypothetical protein